MMVFKLYFPFQSLHHGSNPFLHFCTKDIVVFVLVFQFKSCIKLLQRLKDLLATPEDLHPHLSGEIIVHIFVKFIVLENPASNLILLHKIFYNINSIWEIVINLFLRKANIIRIIRISIHVLCELPVVVFYELIFILQDKVPSIVVSPERL